MGRRLITVCATPEFRPITAAINREDQQLDRRPAGCRLLASTQYPQTNSELLNVTLAEIFPRDYVQETPWS